MDFLYNFFVILELVGIHCTHGVNRTGYVLCRYLIEYLNYEPERAIEGMFHNFKYKQCITIVLCFDWNEKQIKILPYFTHNNKINISLFF